MASESLLTDDRKATERLANERTFLAWVRTSISIMSLGFVVAKFGLWLRELGGQVELQTEVHALGGVTGPAGIGMIAYGGALALLAAWRFNRVDRQIERGLVSADRWLVALIAVTMATSAVVLVSYLWSSSASGPRPTFGLGLAAPVGEMPAPGRQFW